MRSGAYRCRSNGAYFAGSRSTAFHSAANATAHDEGVTTQEYAAAMGLPIDAARGALARAVRDGKLIKGRAIRPRGDGALCPMPVYRPV